MKIAIIGPRVFPTSLKKGVGGLDIRSEQYIYPLSQKHSIYVFIRNWTAHKRHTIQKNLYIVPIWTIKHILFDTIIYSFIATLYGLYYSCDIFMYESTGATSFSFIPRLFGKKIIVTIHAEEWKRDKWNTLASAYLHVLEYLSTLTAHKVVTVSSVLQKKMKQDYGVTPVLIPYYQQSDISDIDTKHIAKLGLQKNQYLLFLGRITSEKRIEWILQSYKALDTTKKLVIAGDNSLDPHYVKYIKTLTINEPNIIFTGHVDGDLKKELLKHCFLFILPSKIEGLSISLLEAMSFHKAILIADISPHNEMIKDKQYLFEHNNFEHFHDQLKKLLNHKKNQVIYPYLKTLPTKKEFINMYEHLIEDVDKN